MGLTYPYSLVAPGAVNIPFTARGIIVSNPTGKAIYIRIGGNDIPDAINPDLYAAPYVYLATPITPSSRFAFGISSAVSPTSPLAAVPTITFTEDPLPFNTSNINLPSVTFDLQWSVFGPLDLNPSQLTTLLTAPAGQQIKLYQLWIWYFATPPTAGAPFSFYLQPAGTGLIWGGTLTAGHGQTDQFNWQPQGWRIGPGNSITLFNFDTVNIAHFFVGIFYQFQ